MDPIGRAVLGNCCLRGYQGKETNVGAEVSLERGLFGHAISTPEQKPTLLADREAFTGPEVAKRGAFRTWLGERNGQCC